MESCPCECRSMNPEATTSPRTSTVSRAEGIVRADVMAAMRPFLIPTCLTASSPVSGSSTRPPTRTMSRRAGALWAGCAAAGADTPASAANAASHQSGGLPRVARLRESIQELDIELLDVRDPGDLGSGRRLQDHVFVRCVRTRSMPDSARHEWQLQPLGE